MRKLQPKLLIRSRLEDQITVMNLAYPGETFLVSKKWFCDVVDLDYFDDCVFNIRVSKFKFNPLISERL